MIIIDYEMNSVGLLFSLEYVLTARVLCGCLGSIDWTHLSGTL